MVFQPDYQIAVGNNNPMGLAPLEGVLVSGDAFPFIPFRAYGNYTLGQPVTRLDALLYFRGYRVQAWQFKIMTKKQYYYLQTTYCGGADGYSGLVTIRTRLSDPDTYANYNAVLHLPQLNELQRTSRVLTDIAVRMIKIEAI